MALTRRAFLTTLGAAVLLAHSTADGQTAPRSRAYRWAGSANQTVRAPFDFTAVGAAWARPTAGLRIRVSADGQAWSSWMPVTTHEAHGRTPPPGTRYYGDLVVVPASRYVQSAADVATAELQLDLIDSSAGPTAPASGLRGALGTTVPIIPRAEWGCDESLRFDASGNEIWPPEYHVPEKVVVHHTVTRNLEANPAATVRSIYYYHAVTQGWGDIGYNYLVDWKGNVYEGRHGGPGVEGGHAYGHNPGSIGIACLGTFDSQSITTEMRQSLARLIAQVAKYVDPHDDAWFVDGDMPNLMGHRDAMQYRPADATECPGDALYALLPGIRGDVAYNLGPTPTPAATILDVSYDRSLILPNAPVKVTVTVKNTGTATLPTQGPTDLFQYAETDTFDGRGYAGRTGLWRIGLDVAGGGAASDYPFRWGLPQALEPGQTATVAGLVKLGSAGQRTCAVGIVRESRYWALRGSNPTTLSVVDPASLAKRLVVPSVPRRAAP